MITPSPNDIKSARKAAKLTQKEAAQLMHVTERAWQYWESGGREMPHATWELFSLKVRSEQSA